MFCWYRSQTFNFSKIDMFYQTNIFLVMNIKLVLLTLILQAQCWWGPRPGSWRGVRSCLLCWSQGSIRDQYQLTVSWQPAWATPKYSPPLHWRLGWSTTCHTAGGTLKIFIGLSHIWLIFLYALSPHTARTYFTRLSPPGWVGASLVTGGHCVSLVLLSRLTWVSLSL